VISFLLGCAQPFLQRLVVLLHFLGGVHETLDDRAHGRLVRGADELLRDVGEIFGVAGGAAGRGADHGHHLLDLAHHLRADPIDLVGEPVGRHVAFVDVIDVGFAERAVARQQVVDGLVQRRVVAGRVGVPDLEVTGRRRLAQRPDLAKGNVRERHRAFVLVGWKSHDVALPCPRTMQPRGLPDGGNPGPGQCRGPDRGRYSTAVNGG
jgi:hypothetical protein